MRDIVLGLDVAFDVFIGLGTLFFAMNMMSDPRFGKIIGWAGIFITHIMLYGAKFYSFPDSPRDRGFPEIGLFTGLWYLALVLLLVRAVLLGRATVRSTGEG